MIRDAFFCPDLPVDSVSPQKLMRNDKDGWFKINGDKAVLEFANGSTVKVPWDPLTSLPMLHSFDDVDSAAEKLEMMFIHASQKKPTKTSPGPARKCSDGIGNWVIPAWAL